MTKLSLAREHQDQALRAMDTEIEAMKIRAETNGGRLPPFVQALNSDPRQLGHVVTLTTFALQQIRLRVQLHGQGR